jgi:hypothetical protein
MHMSFGERGPAEFASTCVASDSASSPSLLGDMLHDRCRPCSSLIPSTTQSSGAFVDFCSLISTTTLACTFQFTWKPVDKPGSGRRLEKPTRRRQQWGVEAQPGYFDILYGYPLNPQMPYWPSPDPRLEAPRFDWRITVKHPSSLEAIRRFAVVGGSSVFGG